MVRVRSNSVDVKVRKLMQLEVSINLIVTLKESEILHVGCTNSSVTTGSWCCSDVQTSTLCRTGSPRPRTFSGVVTLNSRENLSRIGLFSGVISFTNLFNGVDCR